MASKVLTTAVRFRGIAGRAGWGVADQALSSLSNFAVSLVVARFLGITELGAFSLAFATYLFVLNASRALVTDPLVVRFSDAGEDRWRAAAASAMGTTVAIGGIAGLGCVIVGLLWPSAIGDALFALGFVLPGLLLADGWRYAFFSLGRGRRAFQNDLAWLLCVAPTMGIVVATGNAGVQTFVLAWGGSACLAAVYGAIQARVVPIPAAAPQWLRDHRDLGTRYLGENLSLSASRELGLYGLGAIAGLAVVGAYRAGELVLGPLNVVLIGSSMVAVPEAARLLNQRSTWHLHRYCMIVGGALFVACASWGVVALFIPDRIGTMVLGESWAPAAALIIPMCLASMLSGVWVGAQAGLRALQAARRGLRAEMLSSASRLGGLLAGAALSGAAGAAWGNALGNALAVAIWWYHFQRGLQEHADT